MLGVEFKKYLAEHEIDEIFKGLMIELVLAKPESPINFLIKNLQLAQQDKSISEKDKDKDSEKSISVKEKDKKSERSISEKEKEKSEKSISVKEKEKSEMSISEKEKDQKSEKSISEKEKDKKCETKTSIPASITSANMAFDVFDPDTGKSLTFLELCGMTPDRKGSLIPNSKSIPYTQKPIVLILGSLESNMNQFAKLLCKDQLSWLTVSRCTETVMKYMSVEDIKETILNKEFFVENLDKSHDASCFVMVDYPTSMEQLEAFEASIENDQIVVVVYLHLEDSQIILKCLKRLESSIRITRNIPALVALNIQIYKERFDEVLQHYKRFNRFIQIDSNAEHKYGDVVVRIRNLVRDTIYGRAEDVLRKKTQSCKAYRNPIKENKKTKLANKAFKYQNLPTYPLIILVGLPGSLKTKHAMVLASKYPMLGINSTGKNVTDPLAAGCCRWTNPATLIDGNQFEPMNQTVDLIHEMVKHAHSKGQIPILISYPKNLIQLQQFNDKIGLPSIVIHLKCTEEKAVKNLLSQCEETEYSIKNLLSITNGINCYEIHTVPVIKFYQTKSKLFTLETAHKSFEQVQYEIFEQIKVFLPEFCHNWINHVEYIQGSPDCSLYSSKCYMVYKSAQNHHERTTVANFIFNEIQRLRKHILK